MVIRGRGRKEVKEDVPRDRGRTLQGRKGSTKSLVCTYYWARRGRLELAGRFFAGLAVTVITATLQEMESHPFSRLEVPRFCKSYPCWETSIRHEICLDSRVLLNLLFLPRKCPLLSKPSTGTVLHKFSPLQYAAQHF